MEMEPKIQKEEEKVEQIKNCQFRKSLTPKIKKKLFMHAKKLKLLNQQKWCSNNGRYVQQNWDKLMPYVEVGICESFLPYNNKLPDVILTMSNTHFPYLKILDISENRICNIEAVAFLDAQNLNSLNLSQNLIVDFKPLDKTKWNSLKSLRLSNNMINQISFNRKKLKTDQFYFVDGPSFRAFNMDDQEDDSETKKGTQGRVLQNYANLIKLQTNDLIATRYNHSYRIKQPLIDKALERKYPQLNISSGIVLLAGRY